MAQRHASPNAENAMESDSFLDIVSNMVGILIILVLVAGLRIKYSAAGPAEPNPEAVALEAEVARLAGQAQSLESDTHQLLVQAQHLALLAEQRLMERDAVAAQLALERRTLDERRTGLDVQQAEAFDVQQSVKLLSAEIERLEQRRQAAAEQDDEGPVVEIQSWPTAISQTVYGREVHYQLKGGLIVAIPHDELINRFKADAREKANRLRDMAALSETVGPIEGWRLRYKLQRVDMTFDPNVRGPQQVGSFVRLQEYTLIPVSGQMGEPLDEALRSTSQFRSSLAGLSPRDTTVTLWTYPDSFGEYRRLKEELHKAGYSVAGRPLPEGHPIGGSPSGSKSAAQ